MTKHLITYPLVTCVITNKIGKPLAVVGGGLGWPVNMSQVQNIATPNLHTDPNHNNNLMLFHDHSTKGGAWVG